MNFIQLRKNGQNMNFYQAYGFANLQKIKSRLLSLFQFRKNHQTMNFYQKQGFAPLFGGGWVGANGLGLQR